MKTLSGILNAYKEGLVPEEVAIKSIKQVLSDTIGSTVNGSLHVSIRKSYHSGRAKELRSDYPHLPMTWMMYRQGFVDGVAKSLKRLNGKK